LTQQIKISDFSKGLIQDIDDTTENIQNSVNDCLNVDFNSTIGAVEKRKSIEYTTNWTHDTDLDMGAGYTPAKIFDFVGSDNNTIQIVCGVTTGNIWKIWYRVGTEDWILFGGTDRTYTLDTGDEPQFQSLDGSCRIAFGKAVTPKILFYKKGTWHVEDAYPGITTGFGADNFGSFDIIWDSAYDMTFTLPVDTIWPISVIHKDTSNSYTFLTGYANIDCSGGGSYEERSQTMLENFKKVLDIINNLWTTGGTDAFYDIYKIDVSIEPASYETSEDGRPVYNGNTSVQLRIKGYVIKDSSSVKSFTSAVCMYGATEISWARGFWSTTDVLVLTEEDTTSYRVPKGSYSFKVTAVFDNNETMEIKDCSVITANDNDIINNIFVIRFKYRVTDLSTRFRAFRIYKKFTACELETKEISETAYRLVREIAIQDVGFTPDTNDRKLVASTGLGSNPWTWILETINGETWYYMDLFFTKLNLFVGEGTLFDIMQDYRKEEKRFYKDAIYLGGRRYIFGCDDYKDRVYFSTIVSEVPYPQLDIFAGHNYFSVGDNEIITKILIWRDNILVFTEQNIFYVVTQDTDYKVTDNFIGQGTKYPNTIVITPRGIIWANDRGVFIFEGSAPKNISIGRWENTWLTTTKTYCHAAYCKYNNSYWLSVSSTIIMVYNADMDYWTKYKPVAINGYNRFYFGMVDSIFYLVTYVSNTIIICKFPGTNNPIMDYYKTTLSPLSIDSYVVPAYIVTQRLYDNNDIQKLFTKIDIKCLFDDDYYRPIVTYKMDGIEITADNIGSTWNSIIDGYITLPIPTGETVKEITVPVPTGTASDIQIKILSVGDNTVNKNFRVKSILVYYEPLEELKNVYKTI
jgi:hypothetical protein